MAEHEKNVGTVLSVKGNKALLLVDGTRYYILLDRPGVKLGETVEFDSSDDALAMPSYLFAIAAMEEDDLSLALDSIKENWFRGK